MRKRQLIGQLAVGAGIVALIAACGAEGNGQSIGGVPTTVVGRAPGQITVAPTVVYSTATRGATVTRTAAATPGASPTR